MPVDLTLPRNTSIYTIWQNIGEFQVVAFSGFWRSGKQRHCPGLPTCQTEFSVTICNASQNIHAYMALVHATLIFAPC